MVVTGRTRERENDDLDEEFYRAGGIARLQVPLGTAVIFSRGPIGVGNGINKKHTADIHRGRFLSFVYHACSVHNCVVLVGKGWSVEQDRHRNQLIIRRAFRTTRGQCASAQGGTACSCYRTMPPEYSVTRRQTARLSQGPDRVDHFGQMTVPRTRPPESTQNPIY